jgi:phage terminase large subunit GpA-like protein
MIFDEKYKREDFRFLKKLNSFKPTTPPSLKVSNYIEGKRILPPNTPFPGFWRNEVTPYSVEIMDNMGPDSFVQHTAVMKGAQLGLTAAAENVIAYWMDENPSEILFISATESLLEKWAIKRLEPLIDSCGIRPKIFAQLAHKGSRRTGDKLYIKEFVGGTLDMASAQSAPSLRAESKRVLLRDEIDGAPAQLKTGEGNWLDVSYVRTNAWGARRKIFDFSTPTTFEASLINQEYLRGDQRQFFIPCPHCGKFQVLDWGNTGSVHGIKADTKNGVVSKVFYICDYCHDAFFNHDKSTFLAAGEWRPTAESFSKFYRSYQISSLYSPIGMLNWVELYEKYLQAQETPDGMRSFVNLYFGLPFKEVGARPKLQKVMELRGTYKTNIVPDGVLFITAAIDVQRGSASDKSNPPRLEMEICGHGDKFKTWSIAYEVFEGDVTDPFDGAWKKLIEYGNETGFKYKRSDGRQFGTVLIFIDSGDGNLTDVVYRFTQQWGDTYPSKGFSALKKRKTEEGDTIGPSNFKRYRKQKLGEEMSLFEISTNFYKTNLYNNLKISRQDTPPQKPGFCDFPISYDENYFKALTAEEKRIDRDGFPSFHCPSGRRNEALDCRVMNLCAADVFLDQEVMYYKSVAIQKGATKDQVRNVDHRMILDQMIKATSRKH